MNDKCNYNLGIKCTDIPKRCDKCSWNPEAFERIQHTTIQKRCNHIFRSNKTVGSAKVYKCNKCGLEVTVSPFNEEK